MVTISRSTRDLIMSRPHSACTREFQGPKKVPLKEQWKFWRLVFLCSTGRGNRGRSDPRVVAQRFLCICKLRLGSMRMSACGKGIDSATIGVLLFLRSIVS